jgi:hypothetical protein
LRAIVPPEKMTGVSKAWQLEKSNFYQVLRFGALENREENPNAAHSDFCATYASFSHQIPSAKLIDFTLENGYFWFALRTNPLEERWQATELSK